MGKSPFSFDGCHICEVSRQAERSGRSLSSEELMAAFEEQSRQQTKAAKASSSKTHPARPKAAAERNDVVRF